MTEKQSNDKQNLVKLSNFAYEKLTDIKRRKENELGRRVSYSEIIEELLEKQEVITCEK